MDCLYNSYANHVEHLGLKTRDTRAIFYAMRSSVLPISGVVSPTKKAVVGRRKKHKKRHRRGKHNGQVHQNNAGLELLMPGSEIVPFKNEPTDEEIEEMLEEMNREDSLVDALSKINEQDGGFDPTDAFAAADENGLIDGIPWFQKNEDFWEQNGFLIEEDSGLLLPNPGAEISSAIIDRVVEKPKQERPEWVKEALGEDDDYYYGNYNYYPRKSYSSGLRMAYTPTSVAPWIINTLARLDGLNVKMQNWSWYNSEALMQEAETDAERQIIMTSSYGEEVQNQEDITLEPAIYCITSSKHAQFGAVKPKHGVIALAIQLSLP